MPRWTLEARPYRAGDAELLLEGHERAVRAAGGGPRRERSELEWRYGRAPHGACVALALDENARPLAGLAATRQRVRFQGNEVYWLEVGELFGDFAHGQGLARAGALLAAGEAFAETFGGFAPERHPVLYGVPDRRAHRLGLAKLGWEVLRSENELVLDLAGPAPRAPAGVELEELARFPHEPDEVHALFERCTAERAAVLVRDAAYLNWRYVDVPGVPATPVLARRAGALVGFAVTRDGWILDCCTAPHDEDALQALLLHARAGARAAGASTLSAVFPDTAPEWLLFQRLGFRVQGTREYLCFRSFQRPAIMSWLFHHWSYSRGDTLR